MTSLLKIMLILHIISGFISLACGLISMLNKKGARQHRLTGKIFFAGMTGVFITATFISIAKNIPFLFMVGFFSYYLACSGYRVLYLKKVHAQQQPAFLDWTINIIGIVSGLALVAFSYVWFTQRGMWGAVPLLFGLTCLISGFKDIRLFYKRPAEKQHWFFTHGSRMGGAFSATVTAFIVVNVQIGSLTWLLWILPGVLIGFWISAILKRYRKIFQGKKTTGVAEPAI
ncbi:hypothetical protein FAM09_00730 [Niastella caeni]|uniref:DUF2306 domain-containing protein n=1 Tax=Niastella caeni TaxID=2569763 RepID=A0A4S8I3E5_9BACT|nr:hypothetical protein [Niastella caeni]THU40672.1 hypothetical protein FAM09_00730 [Niastella caeni]